MPLRPRRPRGRHFNDGSGWGSRYDKWEAARVLPPTMQDVVTTSIDVDTQTIPAVGLTSRPTPPRTDRSRPKKGPVRRTMPGTQQDSPTSGRHRSVHPDGAESGGRAPESSSPERGGTPRTASPQKSSVARSSFVMFLGTFFSRFLGLVRSPILLGAVVGMTSPAANSFDVANKLPNLIYMVVIGGLVNAVLVPAIVRATKASDDDGAAFINKLLTLAIVFLGSMTLVITLAAPIVVKMFAATMAPDWYALTVAFAYWCLPQIFFYGMYTVLGQILNARENFGPYMWAPALNNVVAIAGMLAILWVYGRFDDASAGDPAMWTGQRIAMLGGFSTLGIVAQALVLVWPMYRLGIRFRPDFKWRNSGLGAAGRASWWILLMMIAGIVPSMIESNVAASATARAQEAGQDLLHVAGNFAYTTAYTIYSLPTSLIVISIATAMFTRLAKAAANDDMATMRRDTSVTLRTVSTLMFLITALMVVLSVPMARLLAVTIRPEEVVTLSRVVMAMSLGLVGVAAINVLNRVFYAFEDTRKVFLLGLPFQVLGIGGFLLSALLPPQWVVVGIGITMSLLNTFSALVMAQFARRRMGGIDGRRLVASHLRLTAITVLTMLVGWGVTFLFKPLHVEANAFGAVVVLAVGGVLMVATYGLLMKILKMEEWTLLMSPVRSIARRLRR